MGRPTPLVVLLAAAVLSAAGCAADHSAHAGRTAASATPAPAVSLATPQTTSPATLPASPAQPVGSGGPCPVGAVGAVINHQAACLRAGQPCLSAYRQEYPRYGFLCLRQGNGQVLFKK